MFDPDDSPPMPAELAAALLGDPTLADWEDETGRAGVYLTRLTRTLGVPVRRGYAVEFDSLSPEVRATIGGILAEAIRLTAAAREFRALGGLH